MVVVVLAGEVRGQNDHKFKGGGQALKKNAYPMNKLADAEPLILGEGKKENQFRTYEFDTCTDLWYPSTEIPCRTIVFSLNCRVKKKLIKDPSY